MLWDEWRNVLVVATPEEVIRQKFVKHLHANLGVPAGRVSLEKAMNHFKRDARGRADIIVWDPVGRPLFIVECKAPGVPLTDDVFDQASRYHEVAEPYGGVIALTNGGETIWYSLDSSTRGPTELAHAPRYDALVAGELPPEVAQVDPPERPHHEAPTADDYDLFDKDGLIGLGSPKSHHGYLSNL